MDLSCIGCNVLTASPLTGEFFSVSVRDVGVASRCRGRSQVVPAYFSLPGSPFEEPQWRGGKLLLNGLHWDMNRETFVQVSRNSGFAGITPHHILVKCDVSGLCGLCLNGALRSPLITALPKPHRSDNEFFTRRPIRSGRVLCSYQVRYRL